MYRGRKIHIRKENDKNVVYLKKSNQFFLADQIASDIMKKIDMGEKKTEIIAWLVKQYNMSVPYAQACIFNITSCIQRDSVGTQSNMKFSAPIRAGWRVTPKCNLRCKHCYLDCANKVEEKELSLTECKLIVDKIDSSGIMEILVTGGELFMRSDIRELLEYITEKNINITLFTNATLINESYEWLKNIQIRKINISLDGMKEAHDFLRGQGNFDKTMKAIGLLKQWGISVAINCVVSTFNIDKIGEIEKFFEKEQLEHQYTMITPVGSAKDNGYLVPSEEQYKNATKLIYDMVRETGKVASYYDVDDERFIVGKNDVEMSTNIGWMCNAGHTKVDIDYNGDVYLCPFDSTTKICNLISDELNDAWSKRYDLLFMKNKKTNVKHICDPLSNYMKEFQEDND